MVHQLIPNFSSGDASSLAALHLRRLLRRLGHAGEIYALEAEPGLSSLVRPASLLRPLPQDWIFYQHGIASPLSGRMLHLRCRWAVAYHNITPARFYPGSLFRRGLLAGRAQLKAMANHLDLAIAVSNFNAEELRANGYRNVHVVLDGIAGASAVVVPSRYESLSLLALEALSQGTRVLANGESEVLESRIRRSKAGFTYRNSASFVEGFRQASAEREELSRRGRLYARRHRWKRVLDVSKQELGRIAWESK